MMEHSPVGIHPSETSRIGVGVLGNVNGIN